jgi:membrane protein implicated in regulation of membrane protease activity
MDLGSPETWRWIWMVAVIAFTVGELAVAGSFFLAPFAVGALVAAVAAFAGVSVTVEWALFLAGSAATFAAMRPLARRLEAGATHSQVGAQRWVSREALVIQDIPGHPGGGGRIRLDREEWRAESLTGAPIPKGSTVLVSRVDGTRLVVVPLDEPFPLPSPEEGAS